MKPLPRQLERQRRGSLLVVTLIVIALLTLGAMAFSQRMSLEFRATRAHARHLQARHLAESGIDYLTFILSQDKLTILQSGGLYLNPTLLQNILVNDDPVEALRGRFTFVAPDMTTDGIYTGLRYGALENESSRLNLNLLLVADQAVTDGGRTLLMTLPGMTEPIADAIMDWLDEDDTPRLYGAEANEYASANLPYTPRNGPLHSLEELLLVRDVTPALLYGADINRDVLISKAEEPLTQIENADNTTGLLNRGWAAYLTLDSAERNRRPDGTLKVNVNMTDKALLQQSLTQLGVFTPDQVNFIIAYRMGGQPLGGSQQQGGGQTGGGQTGGGQTGGGQTGGGQTGGGQQGGGQQGGGQQGGGQQGGGQQGGGQQGGGQQGGGGGQATPTQTVAPSSLNFDFAGGGNVTLTSILDLIGATASVTQAGQTQPVNVVNPFTNDPGAMQQYLPALMENLAVNTSPSIPGRLNINQAPQNLLMGIPGMDVALLEAILATRDMQLGLQQSDQMHETWLMTRGLVDLTKMKQLLPFITSGGDVYRARIVGYFDGGGPQSRLEVVVDATKRPAAVLRRWELVSFGQDVGYTPEELSSLSDSKSTGAR